MTRTVAELVNAAEYCKCSEMEIRQSRLSLPSLKMFLHFLD
jgi:hypothetical protein